MFRKENAENIKIHAKEQYKNTDNLSKRQNLWCYGDNPKELTHWIYSKLDLKPNMKILEIGGGKGNLWMDNANLIPKSCEITWTDASQAMLNTAKNNLKRLHIPIDFFNLKAHEIFTSNINQSKYDRIIACHMLYHVPNLPELIQNLKKILKEKGKFIATTVFEEHTEELFSLFKLFNLPISRDRDIFSNFFMKSGQKLLKTYFNTIDAFSFLNNVKITSENINVLINYINSMYSDGFHSDRNENERIKSQMKREIENRIQSKGFFQISGKTGLIIAYD